MRGYVGSYRDGGLYSFELDLLSGFIKDIRLIDLINEAKYLAFDNGYLYSLFKLGDKAGVKVYKDSKEVGSILYENETSCYIVVIDNFIYTANYHEGSISKLSFIDNELELIKKTIIKDSAGAHQVIPYKDYLLVPCLLLDEIQIFDKDLNYIKSIVFDKGSGPRHGVFNKQGDILYLLEECTHDVVKFKCDDLDFKEIDRIAATNEIPYKQASAIRLSSDERYLYVGNRGNDTISIISIIGNMKIIDEVSSYGKHPRDMVLVNDEYIIAANLHTSNLVSFKVDDEKLVKVDELKIRDVVSIIMEEKYE